MIGVPMFPLGSVLFPHALLPLRIFEPRYQALLDSCLAGDGRFGVVLIERGFEVGGGEDRFAVGTLAQILEVATLPSGDRLLVAAGLRRIRVDRWLPDDPFPRAKIVELPDPVSPEGLVERVEVAEMLLRRVLALRSEAGYEGGGVDFGLAGDPIVAGYQLCVLAPLSEIDLQGLLETEDPLARIDRLAVLLEDEVVVLRQRLGGG